MQKVFMAVGILLLGFCANVTAQDKVVVVPLGSNGKIGGTDKQIQYNDSGNQEGAEVYYDKTTGYVGIGTPNPARQLEISGEGTKVVYVASGFGDSWIDSSPMFVGRKARGSFLSPSAVLKDDTLTYVGAKGYDGVSWDFLSTGGILFLATENHDAFSKGTGIRFVTTPNGATNKIDSMWLAPNGDVGIGTRDPKSKLAVNGLPTAAPDSSGKAGVVCVTNEGNFWLDNDGVIDCE